MINKKLAAGVIIVTAIIFAFAVARAFGSIPQPRPNSLGVHELYSNPNTYLVATPVEGRILDGRFTNIRFQPYAAPLLFDESILFCGDVTEKFDGMIGSLAVTFRTQASGRYQGVGCHELVSVFEVKGK